MRHTLHSLGMPKIVPTGFSNITFDQLLTQTETRSRAEEIYPVNERGQNLVHYFVSDPKRWNAGYFLTLLSSTDLPDKRKQQLIAMANSADENQMTPAHYAAIYGDIHWLNELSRHTSLLKPDSNLKSPINYILDHNHPELLSEFIEICLENNVNKDLGEGKTLAHCIATQPNAAKLFAMLSQSRHDCDIRAKDKHGMTPLMLAAASGKLENIEAVLEVAAEQAKQDLRTQRYHQMLDLIASKKTTRTKKPISNETLLSQEYIVAENAKRELLNMTNNHGQNVLHILVSANPHINATYLESMAKLMAVMGSNIATKDMLGDNIAHIAARAGNLDLLIELATDPTRKDLLTTVNVMNQTPLHLLLRNTRSTLENRQEAYLKKMVSLGRVIPTLASIQPDNQGNSMLHYAAGQNHHELLKLLLLHTLVLTWHNINGQTPLHLAAREGHEQAIKLLLNHKIDIPINAKDKDGNTALHCAAAINDLSSIKLLVKAGADPYLANNDSKTVFDLLDKTAGKNRTPEEEKVRVAAYASLVLYKGVQDFSKNPQMKEANKALHIIAKQLTKKLHEILVATVEPNLHQFSNQIQTATKEVLQFYRPLSDQENRKFSKALNKTLAPVMEDMLELHRAKNYESKRYTWNLVNRLVDFISNALIVAKYMVLGLGRSEERLFKYAQTAIQEELKQIPEGKFTAKVIADGKKRLGTNSQAR